MSEPRRQILIVDDSPEDRATFRRFLERDPDHDHAIWEADTAEEGLALCRQHQPDCILLDYRLPDQTGLEFLACLQAEKRDGCFVPVVMLTGQGDEAIAVEAMKAGAQDYLPKGAINPRHLRFAVAKAIEKASLLQRVDQQSHEIRRRLGEKEILLREIHHRVKNNLQVILSLLQLQSSKAADAKITEALRESQARVKSIALIHEKLYRSADLARVDFGPYVRDLIADLFHAYQVNQSNVIFTTRIERVCLEIDTAVPCGLIINELIANSLKHAFPAGRAGSVHVGLGPQGEGEYLLVVHDDGAGMPPGFDWRESESLGLQLVQNLTAQLDGQVEAESGPAGTTFTICFRELGSDERE